MNSDNQKDHREECGRTEQGVNEPTNAHANNRTAKKKKSHNRRGEQNHEEKEETNEEHASTKRSFTSNEKKGRPGKDRKGEEIIEEQRVDPGVAVTEEPLVPPEKLSAVGQRQAVRREALYEYTETQSSHLKINPLSTPSSSSSDDDKPVFLEKRQVFRSGNEHFLDEQYEKLDYTADEKKSKYRTHRDELLIQDTAESKKKKRKIRRATRQKQVREEEENMEVQARVDPILALVGDSNIVSETEERLVSPVGAFAVSQRQTTRRSVRHQDSETQWSDLESVHSNLSLLSSVAPFQDGGIPVGAFAVSRGQATRRYVSRQDSDTQWSDLESVHSNLSLLSSVAPLQDGGTPMLLEAQLARPVEDLEAELSRRQAEEMQGLQTEIEDLRQSQLSNLPLAHAEVTKGIQKRKRLLMFCIMSLVVAVMVFVAVIVSTQQRTESPTNAPTTGTQVVLNRTWSQVGQDLAGEAPEDQFGISLSLSRDARVMVVGATQKKLKGNTHGYASVFQLEKATNSWTRKGQVLIGDERQDLFGMSVSLNSDGTILAVGALQKRDRDGISDAGYVRVYEYNVVTEKWDQLGKTMRGDAVGDEFGTSVSLSSAGDTLVVGARRADTSNGISSGIVRAFRYNRGTLSWVQLGQTLAGQTEYDLFGESVSLSSSGSIFAAGARSSDIGGRNAGLIAMYRYNSTSAMWLLMGETISGEPGGLLGSSVSLSSNGMIVAAGAPGSSDGRVLSYEYDVETSTWTQRGQTLETQQQGDDFGGSVSLNGEGNMLAVGSRFHNAGGLTNSGQVVILIYDIDAEEWHQLGEGLYGEASEDRFGHSVSLSGNGTIVGIGSSGSYPNSNSSGSAYTFKMIE